MPISQNVVRVFLASPGGLEDERLAIRDAVDEVNDTTGMATSFHVELVGWEDTMPNYGRPQELINSDLEKCECFIGVVWDRWGTPTGRYSSGFEEEYELAIARRAIGNEPEISIFFKQVDEKQERDPGDQLKKVVEFKNRLISEKKVLFSDFSNVLELQRKIRTLLSRKIMALSEEYGINIVSEEEKEDQMTNVGEEVGFDNKADSIFLQEELVFLQLFQNPGNDSAGKGIDALSVARFRLLAATIKSDINDDMYLEPHDANIIFRNRNNIELSEREKKSLVESGSIYFLEENSPLWYWISKVNEKEEGFLLHRSMYSPSRLKIGAIRVLEILGDGLSFSETLDRDRVLRSWFGKDQSEGVKLAAIQYLRGNGEYEDIGILLNEIKVGSYRVVDAAKECAIVLALRRGGQDAIEFILDQRFTSFSDSLVESIFRYGASIGSDALRRCLEVNDAKVRFKSLELLRNRNEIDSEEAKLMLQDEDSKIRLEGALSLVGTEKELPLAEAKRTLERNIGGLFSLALRVGPRRDGEAEYESYKEYFLSTRNVKELILEMEKGSLSDRDAFFWICRKRFSKYKNELISGLNDGFDRWFDQELEHLLDNAEEGVVPDRLISRKKDILKAITIKGLDVLCDCGSLEYISVVRNVIEKFELPFSESVGRFFEKNGEWSDISIILSASSRKVHEKGDSFLGSLLSQSDWPARAISGIGRGRIREVVKIPMSDFFVERIIFNIRKVEFIEISNRDILGWLRDERHNVRKLVALNVVLYFPKKRIVQLLERYIAENSFRYYNSIFWLDLGASLDRSKAIHVASIAKGKIGSAYN